MAELASTIDPAGRRVVLTDERWAHVVTRHEAMSDLLDEVIRTVFRPDFVTPDAIARRQRFWRHSIGPTRWIRVVVDFAEEPAIIVTAFPDRRDPRCWPSALLP